MLNIFILKANRDLVMTLLLMLLMSTMGAARASDKKLWLKLPQNEVDNGIIGLQGEDDLPLKSNAGLEPPAQFVGKNSNRPIRDLLKRCFWGWFQDLSKREKNHICQLQLEQ